MKKLVYLSAILFCSATARAQYNLGIATSKWSGMNSLYLNPANIADNKARFAIDIFSVNAGVDNSLGTLNNSGGIIGLINDGNTNNIFRYSSNDKFSFLAPYANVHLPGVMVSINHRHSVALSTGVRGFNQFNNFDQSLYKTLTDDNYLPDGVLDLTSTKFNYTAHVWSEIGLSYAGVLVDEQEHELKAGFTVRYLGGIGYLGLKGNNLDAHYKSNNDSLFVTNSDLEFASNIISTKSAILNGISNNNILDQFFGSKDGHGFGGDIGIVYEFKPGSADQEKNSRHKKSAKRNEYKLRVGASVMDIGAIKYKSDVNSNARVTGNGIIAGDDFSKNVTNFDEFRSYAVSHGFTADTGHRDTKVYMPTRLNLSADYRVYRAFYLNAMFVGNLAKRQNFGNSYYNQFTVTPRFDIRMLSIGVPITYSSLANKVKVGFGFRITGFFIGSDDVVALVGNNQSGFNFYAGGYIPFNKHKVKETRHREDKENKDDMEPEPDMDHGGSSDTTSGGPEVSALFHNSKMPAGGSAMHALLPANERTLAYHKEYAGEAIEKKD